MAVTSSSAAGLSYKSSAGRWVLLATILGSSMASIDATVVGIALPAMGGDSPASLASLQWVVTAYTLTLAGLLLYAGGLGDKYGRKKIFLIGVIWFAVASAICGIALNAPMLIVARAVQGIGAALLTPGSLAIIEASFRPEDRSKAIGAWTGFAGVGTAIGPFLGGWLIAAVSWRLIFIINLQVAGLVLVGALGPGGPVFAVYLVRERGDRKPLLPLSMFASAEFSAANVVTFVVYGALGGTLFLLPIQLEQVSGYSALEAGVSLLPVTVIMLLLSARSGALAARIGPRLQMSVGPVVIGAGLLLLTRVGSTGNY